MLLYLTLNKIPAVTLKIQYTSMFQKSQHARVWKCVGERQRETKSRGENVEKEEV